MSNIEKNLLEIVLGTNFIIPVSNEKISNNNHELNIVSSELFSSLSNYLGSTAPFFQTSLPLDRIVRYKDGSFSSMEKSIKGSFSQHQGFEIINVMDMAQNIMNHVTPMLNQRLSSIYTDLINQNSYYLNQIKDNIIIPEISKLKSISEYIKDVSDDIQSISKSTNLSIATLTNLQRLRVDLKQTFYIFINRLEQSTQSLFFTPIDIANNYLIARYALSNYIVSLVFECIISGNIDDESIRKMESKIDKCFQKLNAITNQLAQSLDSRKFANCNEINSITQFFQWSYNFLNENKLINLQNENFHIEFIKNNTLSYFDVDFENRKLKDFINARHSLIKNIKISASDDEDFTKIIDCLK